MARWLLVRNGATLWNAEDRLQGHSLSPLSPEGIRQSELLASRLVHTPLTAIYTSDLPRARETAESIAAGSGITVLTCQDLRERSYGEWEGSTHAEIQTRSPDRYRLWREGQKGFRPPGRESLSEVLDRVSRLAVRLRETHTSDESVLLVGHFGSFSPW